MANEPPVQPVVLDPTGEPTPEFLGTLNSTQRESVLEWSDSFPKKDEGPPAKKARKSGGAKKAKKPKSRRAVATKAARSKKAGASKKAKKKASKKTAKKKTVKKKPAKKGAKRSMR
jgi:hypothetical protein